MLSDILNDFGSIELDEEEDPPRNRGDRLQDAFLQSQESIRHEQIFTERGWYDPPQIPAPSSLHVRNIDYTLNSLYLKGRYQDALRMALAQIEGGQDGDGKEGRTKELMDLAIRCARRVDDKQALEQLVDRTKVWWPTAPGLAAVAAEGYLHVSRPRDALSAALSAVNSRGTLPPYISLIARALDTLSDEISTTDGQAAIRSMLSLVMPHTRPFRELFPELNSRPRSAAPSAVGWVDAPNVETATKWICDCGIDGVNQDRLLALLCHRRNAANEVDLEGRSVRTL